MSVETTRMSSKGQVVIPQDLRDDMDLTEGTLFAVVGDKDSIILKRIDIPSKESMFLELDKIAEEATARLKKKGIKESDFVNIVHKRRQAK